ncbi:MAG: tetratricopeptide repeat protein [Bacteroidetes bacterium]|nr:tetratricopeptide repeat protein [Bacteroidota bacterium]
MAIEKGDLDALFNLANLYKEQGKEKEAEQYYLLAIEKEDIGALVNLALLYQKQGKEKEAELYYLLAIKKENIYALNNLALLYEKQGKEKDAEKYFILALEKGNIDAFYNLTLKYYQQNNKQKLRNLIERLQEKDLNLFKEKYSQFLSFIFLYLGEMDDFKKISDRFLVQTETLVSSMFLNSLLIHKQTNWVINYFKINNTALEQYKPLYYATLTLAGNNDQELLKMPPEIEENVTDIIASIKKEQQFYYGQIFTL